MSSSATTGLSPSSTPSLGCLPNSFPNLDLSGLNGTVCAVSQRPAFLNITSCCSGSVRVANNCTQYCETEQTRFGDCLTRVGNGTSYQNLCQVVTANSSQTTSTGNGTGGNGAGVSLNRAMGPVIGTAGALALLLVFL